MNGFDSIQVRFSNTQHIPSPFANTRVVPFVDSYFTVLKSVIDDIKTEYFWFFANFVNLNDIDLDFIPEQHERDQIHVWYTTHPKGGLNKEGNVMLIPTKKIKEQLNNIKFLRDYEDINYHPNSSLYQQPIPKTIFKLGDPMKTHHQIETPYSWMVNKDLELENVPNFYPSFWEDIKLYSWGKTKDIMLVPRKRDIKQLYDIDRSVHFDIEYQT